MSPESFQISIWDILIFVAFVVTVVGVGLYQSRSEKGSEDYFLAGRDLKWWLIGFSLIASNISTEQFVGMSGNAASHVGLAIASYEWMAAITLVIVAFAFLPYFLRTGIYTMPQFLEVRYDGTARTIMAVATILIYLLLLGSVTYSGALVISTLAGKAGYQLSLATGSLIIGVIAMAYVTAGGLKAAVWADLIQGSALILGGAVIIWFAFQKLGMATEAASVVSVDTGAVSIQALAPDASALERFWDLNKPRMNMFLPATDTVLPWTALMLGLWIPNFYYWGLNQYITQRTLGSASLAEGQKGIVFAASMKLLIPFLIVVPGIIAFNLYSQDMRLEARGDTAGSMALYLDANPDTRFVETLESPTEAEVAAWPAGRYLLAVYPDAGSIAALQAKNPWVLPITRDALAGIRATEHTVFVTEDQSWAAVNPGLAEEIEGYNAGVRTAAEAAGARTTPEKMIAYKYDTALAQLLGHVLPQGVGIVGFVLAALLGAVVSSLAAMLNAASTIFSIDVYKKFIRPQAAQDTTVKVGRFAVIAFGLVAIFLAPQLGDPAISNSIFTIIQEGQGFISPGILAVFAFGLLVRRGPAVCGTAGLLTNIVAYGALKLLVPELQFLNRMAVCFGLCLLVMTAITLVRPRAEPIVFEQNTAIALETSGLAKLGGILVVATALLFYFLFSPVGLAG
jgi:SSS family solute:Na+ symporter